MWKLYWFLLLVTTILMAKLNLSFGQKPKIGETVNIFNRYGYLSISMRVVPRNDTDNWVFREPTLEVLIDPIKISTKQNEKSTTIFNGDFHMEFCDNIRQLLQAYFRDFTFERLEKPWKAFTGSWTKGAMSKYLGINSSFISDNHCYVLVRVARFKETKKLTGTPDTFILDDSVLKEINNVTIGDTSSVVRFIKNFGSHYISSFITGNALYQVFVYTPEVYKQIKERLKTRGVMDLSNLELSNYFSPWYAEHMGKIQSTSGNRSVEIWASERLRFQYYIFTYVSLLKLHGDSKLLRELDGLLGDEALLQLQLRTFAPFFKDTKRRDWFLQVIDNYFKLWEVNM